MSAPNVVAINPQASPSREVLNERLLKIQTDLLRAEGLARLVAYYAHGLHGGEVDPDSAWHAEEGADTLAELLVAIHDDAAAVTSDREVQP